MHGRWIDPLKNVLYINTMKKLSAIAAALFLVAAVDNSVEAQPFRISNGAYSDQDLVIRRTMNN